MKNIIFSLIASSLFAINAFADECADFSGHYRVVPGTERSSDLDDPWRDDRDRRGERPFAFPARQFRMLQLTCEQYRIKFNMVTYALHLKGDENGEALLIAEGQPTWRRYILEIKPLANGRIRLLYKEWTPALGRLAKVDAYSAEYRK